VATKPEAGKADEGGKAAPKSKKMLLIVGVVVLALAAGGGWFFMSKKSAASDEDVEEVAPVAHKGPPAFLPLDNMVVNLADPGGEKVAQVGITLELSDAKASDSVKVYLPSIRSGILLLISQRTSEELLGIEGKEKLAQDVLAEALRPFGGGDEDDEAPKKKSSKSKKKRPVAYPVLAVHFSSFIVQ
jgi:flagellar protein FliL